MMKRYLIIASLAFGIATSSVQADDFSRDEIKEIVLETLRENPEILLEVSEILQRKGDQAQAARTAETLDALRPRLENDPNAPVLGNPNGDVTVVEFFDYNCPFCRRVKPAIENLLEQDRDVRLVYREWPILGEGSVFAARAALASIKQGKYEEFHWAMMGMQGRAEEATVLQIAETIGLDIEQLLQDMKDTSIDEHIATSSQLTQILGFRGTPSFVIGDVLVPGIITSEALIQHVTEARASKK